MKFESRTHTQSRSSTLMQRLSIGAVATSIVVFLLAGASENNEDYDCSKKGAEYSQGFLFCSNCNNLNTHIHFVYLHWLLKVLNIGLSNSQHRELNWEFEPSRTRLANTRQLQTAVKKKGRSEVLFKDTILSVGSEAKRTSLSSCMANAISPL